MTRGVCEACGRVSYANPRPVVSCLVEQGDQLLLCRRAIEPGYGRWTLPGGFHEVGESSVEGALRECYEEAVARVAVTGVHAVFDLPDIGQVHSFFRAHFVQPGFAAGDESLDVQLFGWDAIPWDELAFPVTTFALRLLMEDRARGVTTSHQGTLRWSGEGDAFDAARYRLDEHLTSVAPD